jgi:hypothetical protein
LIIVGWQSVTGVDGAQNFAYVNPPVGPAPAAESVRPSNDLPAESP